ncbi:ParB N-terminal domain-containing protein [Undibacterium aquatile]|uniref:Plasmid replication/partition related protein n=1 Tax=Undibacterium aquatile TaxID=1537398 RepID=A0ABR6XH92_9BURK|nr:hypothetical protein [Undibacterium aquatile]MBC3812142.1 hypothetical protein [Undibacterium aquatile]
MSIIIHEGLRAYIDPLTEHEYAALERSILTEGCRDALVLWGEVLIDGHNRYEICQRHNIPFKTIQNDHFKDIEDVQLWMIDNHLARRSVSDFQRGMLALRKKEIISMRIKAQDESDTSGNEETDVAIPVVKPTQSRQEIARVAGISSNAVLQIEKIQRAAAPELVQAVRDGTISISAAAAVATLPSDEQAAAVAGGRKELQQAAKQVREKIREQKAPAKMNKVPESQETENPSDTANGAMDQVSESVILQQRIKALEAENAALVEKITQLNAALSAATATN